MMDCEFSFTATGKALHSCFNFQIRPTEKNLLKQAFVTCMFYKTIRKEQLHKKQFFKKYEQGDIFLGKGNHYTLQEDL